MISVGIDISKGKSMVCILKPYGEVVAKPFEVRHTEHDLEALAAMLQKLNDEVKVVMEATGVYHLPVLTCLKDHNIFVAVINPYAMKQYCSQGLRRVKTDKADSISISRYGIEHWDSMQEYQVPEEKYEKLRQSSQQYRYYMQIHVMDLQNLLHLLDSSMPGISEILEGWDKTSGRNKLADFADEYWHYANITGKTEKQFTSSYLKWAKRKGYRPSQDKAATIYSMAKDGIPTVSADQTEKMFVHEAVGALKRVDATLFTILSRMQEIAKTLPEYSTVRSMGGVGDTLAPRLIADIGDVRRFHSSKALIAYAGIDAPPYQSGQFVGTQRKISKRGSPGLRKTGYEVMCVLKMHKEPEDNAVYRFILKKETEGKAKKVAKMAGMNKFLRIYYARVMEIYAQ